MYNSTPPAKADLPSTAKLIKSTLLAGFVASILLVTVVMPAEYGIDPTGIGKLTGLQKMGAIKTSLAKDAAAEMAKEQAMTTTPEQITPDEQTPTTTAPVVPLITTISDEQIFTLIPDAWTEIKLTMSKGNKVDFIWFTDAGKANFDTHADSKRLKIDYHNYAKGSKQRDEGVLEAAFDGGHGWFWRNRTDQAMTITLQTNGEYQGIIILK